MGKYQELNEPVLWSLAIFIMLLYIGDYFYGKELEAESRKTLALLTRPIQPATIKK